MEGNHLYWIIQNNNTAASEINGIMYNQVTHGVFENMGGLQSLCKELCLETSQEHRHIHAFQRIGNKTRKALLGKKKLANASDIASKSSSLNFAYISPVLNSTLKNASKLLLRKGEYCSSKYLKEVESKYDLNSVPNQGPAGRLASPALLNYFTLNWGSSPFLSCNYYVLRYIANALVKSQEHPRSRYFKKKNNNNEFVPIPTAVSHFHFLDESYHTTTSLMIAQELYKAFSKPTVYEIFFSNFTIYLAQLNIIKFHSGLAYGLPARCFRDDMFYMNYIYNLLKSSLFGMTDKEAIFWMEKSFCYDHEGFHSASRFHRVWVNDLQNFFEDLDYLWPINRSMSLVDKQGLASTGLEKSRQIFRDFSLSLTSN